MKKKKVCVGGWQSTMDVLAKIKFLIGALAQWLESAQESVLQMLEYSDLSAPSYLCKNTECLHLSRKAMLVLY